MEKELSNDLKEALIESFASTELQECCLVSKTFNLDRYKYECDSEIIKKHQKSQTSKARAENYIKRATDKIFEKNAE